MPTSPDTSPARRPAPEPVDRVVVRSLTDPRCRDVSFAGEEISILAGLHDLLPAPPTAVAVGSPVAWAHGNPSDPLAAGRRLARELTRPVAIRGWLVSAAGSGRPVGPVWYNIGPSAVEECVVELAALSRHADGPAGARLAVSLQAFVSADISVTVTVDRPTGTTRLSSCWGLNEDLGGGVWQDLLVLTGPGLAVDQHRVVHKPTATAAAAGGTRIVGVSPTMRGRPSLSDADARPIARACLAATTRLGGDAEFEIAIEGDRTYLLACHRR
jgi:hypothetical protein